MRSYLMLLTVLLLVSIIAGPAMPVLAAPEALIMVEAESDSAVEALESAGAPVWSSVGPYILAGADSRLEAELRATGAWVVDRHPWSDGSSYYWVHSDPAAQVDLARYPGVEVLHQEPGLALVKASAMAAEPLARSRFDLVHVDRTRKTLDVVAPAAERTGDREFGGDIDTMVAGIMQFNYSGVVQTLQNFGTRYTYTTGVDDAADWMFTRLQGYGYDVERHYFDIGAYSKQNIIATRTGLVYPDEVVLICGHYDSTSDDPENLAPGADDNGSGTAAVLEAARVMAGYEFERTVVFATFAGEEQGLYGSGAYAADLAAAGTNVVGCYNYDMIAWSGSDTAPPDLILYTNGGASTDLANRVRDAALHYVPTGVEPVVVPEAMTASDHASFWSQGYPAICGIEAEAWSSDFNPYYHTTNDTVANCDMAYATACTKAAVAAVAEHASPLVVDGPYLALHDMVVDDDMSGASFGNGNGTVEPGEIVELTLTLRNVGTEDAVAVSGTLSTTSSYAAVSTATQSYGTILSDNGTGTSAGPYVFSVTMDLPDGYEIPFVLAVTEAPATIGFDIAAAAPALAYAGRSVDDSAGDGDGIVDPGETVLLQIDLRNEGSVGATGVGGTLSTSNPQVTVTDNTADWPDISSGASQASLAPHFTVSFGGGLSYGETVSFDLDTVAAEGTGSVTFDLVVGQAVLFFDDMEGGENGWTHYEVAAQDDWMLGYPGPNGNDPDAPWSGMNHWGNDLAPDGWNGDYYANVHNYLQSPAIDCSGYAGVTLNYMRWLTVEDAIFDQATIYVNGTQVWQNAVGADHLDSEWTVHEIDISAIADDNPAVVVEFHMESDGGVEFGGWNIDDLSLLAFDQGGGPVATVAATLTCDPSAGTVPFGTAMSITLGNLYGGFTRTISGHIDITVAGGSYFPNWRAGYTNVAPGGSYTASWVTTIPALGSVIGDNYFELVVEDVTAAPYNQPPYPASGDTDMDGCTVTGIAP